MLKLKRLLIFVLAAACLLSACSSQKPEGGASSEAASSVPAATTQALKFTQTGDLDEIALKTENFSYTKGEFVYMMAVFSSNLAYFGVDPAKSLKEQPYPDAENTSWFDVLLEETQNYATEQLLLCEAAKAKGYALTQEDLDTIGELKKTAEQNAEGMGWDPDTYFQQIYGTNIGWKHMEGVLSKGRLIQHLQDEIKGISFSEEDLEEEFRRDLKQYGVIDYYTVNLADGEAVSDELLNSTKEGILKADSLEAFTAAVQAFLAAGKDASDIQKAGGPEAYTAQYLARALREGVAYQETEFFDWAFGEESQEGDTYILDNLATGSPYAYYLVKKPYRDTSVTVDVRHILFKVGEGDYASAQEARAKADEIYQAWVNEGASEEKFVKLCAEYSADGNAQSGGLYTNVYVGQMVPSFNDWCFDKSRQKGDHGIVDTDFGSHMMYFVNSHVVAEEAIKSSLQYDVLEELMEKQKTLTPVESFREVMAGVIW